MSNYAYNKKTEAFLMYVKSSTSFKNIFKAGCHGELQGL